MSFKQALRVLRLSIGKRLLDKKSGDRVKAKRILFMRQDGKLGDYMVSSFCYREIKNYDPTIHIAVVCTKKDAYLYESNPYIDALYFVRSKRISDYILIGKRLAKLKYDVVIDPTDVLRNRDLLLLRLIRASNYIGYNKSAYKLFSASVEGVQHYSLLYKKALELIDIPVQNIQYDIPTDRQAEQEIDLFLQDNAIDNYLAINFYGAASSRKMSVENIKKHVHYIQQHVPGRAIVLLSYPEKYSELSLLSQEFSHVYVHPTQNVFHTIALIRRCLQLISVDTSTIHIASGFNKKIIAWYGKNEIVYKQWHPDSQADVHVLFYDKQLNELSPEQINPQWIV